MPAQDTSKLKEKIVSIIRLKGPSLPAQIASGIGMSILFSSAFLSELVSEKKLKTSNLKVGSSPLYLIPGQEPQLENFSQYLKSKEREAFEMLKEKGVLKDSEQLPAIRVALKEIKDFAIPFLRDNEAYWKYLTVSDEKIQEETMPLIKEVKKQFEESVSEPVQISSEIEIEDPEIEIKEIDGSEQVQASSVGEKVSERKKKVVKKKIVKKKTSQKKNDKFFNRVKEFLAKKSIVISDIEGFSKNDLILKVNVEGEEKLLVAYNKKTLKEDDVVKAHKKASEAGLKYIVLSLGAPLKKLDNFIEAVRNLDEIDKID